MACSVTRLESNRKPLGGCEKKVSEAEPNNNEKLWDTLKLVALSVVQTK